MKMVFLLCFLMGNIFTSYSQEPEKESLFFPSGFIGFDTRNSIFVNGGFGNYFLSDDSNSDWGNYHLVKILGGFNFKNRVASAEFEYIYTCKTVVFPTVGFNLNSSFKDGKSTFGIKPMVGWDFLFFTHLNLGYNFILNKKIEDVRSQFSFSLYLSIPYFFKLDFFGKNRPLGAHRARR